MDLPRAGATVDFFRGGHSAEISFFQLRNEEKTAFFC